MVRGKNPPAYFRKEKRKGGAKLHRPEEKGKRISHGGKKRKASRAFLLRKKKKKRVRN